MKKISLSHDRMIGGILLVFSVAMLLWIIPLGVEQMGGDVGPGMDPTFIPKLIVFLIGFLAVLLICKPQPQTDEHVTLFPPRTLITIAFFVAYIIVTPILGYLLTSLLILPAYLLFFGARNWRIVLPLSVLLPFGLYLFFAKVMLIMLPEGIFF